MIPLFSLPDDAPRLAALGAALGAAFVLPRWLGRRGREAWFVLPTLAAVLSIAYVHGYLGGGPRIIDASAYWLQARALSEGMFALPLGEPEHAVLGRFLLRTTASGEPAASVIFPPGYPAVLAVGFALGVPLLVGPALAAAVTAVTMDLARRVVRLGPPDWRAQEEVVLRIAGSFSALCAVLRYHTADTMAHGLAALCFAGALAAVIALGDGDKPLAAAAAAGAASGWLFATRPVSALALGATIGVLLATRPVLRRAVARRSGRLPAAPLMAFAAALVPGLALWLAHQSAATGSFTATAQQAYYAVSDGPAGCFRYGFGGGIGCLGEHGQFVRDNLPHGYGLLAALGTTGRRLKMHLGDALNFAPLFPLVLIGSFAARKSSVGRALFAGVALQVLCYAPFYFDGSYPGGGARMFADVLPLEHVLAALAALVLAPRSLGLERFAGLVVTASLLGFAVQTGAEHRALAEREGGRPMFDPSAVTVPAGSLLLLDTDHGFNLAYAPGSPEVARHRGDDLDRLAWEAAGRPPAFRYEHDWSGETLPRLVAVDFDPAPSDALALRIEAESLWPPLAQPSGWAWPVHSPRGCVSNGRVMAIEPTGGPAEVRLRLPRQARGRSLRVQLVLGIDSPPEGKYSAELVIYDGHRELGRERVEGPTGCRWAGPLPLPEGAVEPVVAVRSAHRVGVDVCNLGEKR